MRRTCRQCSAAFEITPDDLAFYGKVSPVFNGKKEMVPPPTLCPDCRNRRRMSWRNDRVFYIRTCDLTGERFLSIYPADSPYTVYRPSAWYSDKWDPMAYGQDIAWDKPFFTQFAELYRRVPTIGIDVINCENSEYCNYCGDDKDCYMDIAGEANEDCYFNLFIKYCKDCCDNTFVYRSTLCYESINCYDCYDVQNSQYLDNCSACRFCFDCKGCSDCVGCVNLRGKKYHIFNEPYSKDDYLRALAALKMETHGGRAALEEQFEAFRLQKGIHRDMYVIQSERCSGNDIHNSKNCHDVYNAVNCEDCRFLNDVLDAKDCHDLNYSLYKPEASYELCSTLQLTFSAFNMASHYSNAIFYCNKVNYSKDLFGCIGLMHKQYCILNKQYTKEEYEALAPKLIAKMRKTPLRFPDGSFAGQEWGEFFPVEISPFAYNETVAQEYYPLTKEEVLRRGWKWRDVSDEAPKAAKVIPAERLPDSIDDIPDDMLNWAVQCEVTKRPFKIIKQELDFYRRMKIPVPHVHPEERHRKRIARRNPRKLWGRTCMKCGKKIQSTYAPGRPEIVYCESCYLKEVY